MDKSQNFENRMNTHTHRNQLSPRHSNCILELCDGWLLDDLSNPEKQPRNHCKTVSWMTVYSATQGLRENWQSSWAHTLESMWAQCTYILLTSNMDSKHHSKVSPSPGLPRGPLPHHLNPLHMHWLLSPTPQKQASYLNPVTNQVTILQPLFVVVLPKDLCGFPNVSRNVSAMDSVLSSMSWEFLLIILLCSYYWAGQPSCWLTEEKKNDLPLSLVTNSLFLHAWK